MPRNIKKLTGCRWMMIAFFILHSSLFFFIGADAQTFTQRLQKQTTGEGTVTLHQDKAIDDLVNGPQNIAPPVVKTVQEKNAPKEAQKDNKNALTASALSSQQQVAKAAEEPDTTMLSRRAGHSYKTTGYRVQVFAGGNSRKDRQQAEQTGSQLRMLFPGEMVYTHFYPPRWICRMGNFRTYEEAHQMLLEVKKLGYTSATIVKGKITVQY